MAVNINIRQSNDTYLSVGVNFINDGVKCCQFWCDLCQTNFTSERSVFDTQ